MTDIKMKCHCGAVKAEASNLTHAETNHAICYCNDCQAFANVLGQGANTLDEYGGTEIFQIPPSHMRFTAGTDQVRCMRVTEKGPHRWYAACCKTPIGNTAGAGLAFVGVIHDFIEKADDDITNGPVNIHVYDKYALKPLPKERLKKRATFWAMVKFALLLTKWRLQGKQKPSPFYDDEGNPISKPEFAGGT